MLIGVHAKPGAADAVAVVLDRPRISAGIERPAAGGQLLASVIAAAILIPPPRRAVAVLFRGIDGMAQPVINIRFPAPSQDDTLPLQRGQRRQRQPIQHDTQDYPRRRTPGGSLPEHPAQGFSATEDPGGSPGRRLEADTPRRLKGLGWASHDGGVSAIMAMRGARFAIGVASGVLALMIVAAGGVAVWYRQAYHVWPGQGASARVRWCGRDYESFGGPPRTWPQITSQEPVPVRGVGQYPPLGWSRQGLFAAAAPRSQRLAVGNSLVCAMMVYLRTGPDHYQAYSLEGGP